MAKKTPIKEDEIDGEEKVISPEIITGEDGVESVEEEDDGAIGDDEVDPYHDKWEE